MKQNQYPHIFIGSLRIIIIVSDLILCLPFIRTLHNNGISFRTGHHGERAGSRGQILGSTNRAVRNNFKIGGANMTMPIELIRAFAILKSAAKPTSLDVLDPQKANMITNVCDEILQGKLDDQFPLAVWQTGSGTIQHEL